MLLQEISKNRNKSYKEISKEAILKLEAYEWPGNVRELRSVIERAVILNDGLVLDADLLFLKNQQSEQIFPKANNFSILMPDGIYPLDDIEYEIAQYVLKRFDGNISQAARYLNVSWRRLKRLAKMT